LDYKVLSALKEFKATLGRLDPLVHREFKAMSALQDPWDRKEFKAMPDLQVPQGFRDSWEKQGHRGQEGNRDFQGHKEIRDLLALSVLLVPPDRPAQVCQFWVFMRQLRN